MLKHFIHHHNVHHPPYRMTERSIELAVADIFLQHYPRDSVVEVGAVTPYYWPHRVARVVDPADQHPLVTDHCDWLATDLSCQAILSISTFEHMGLSDYGQPGDASMSRRALEKLLDSGADFLVTWPGGYNRALDQQVSELAAHGRLHVLAWQREKFGNEWQWVDFGGLAINQLQYGPYWANTLLMLHRGPALG